MGAGWSCQQACTCSCLNGGRRAPNRGERGTAQCGLAEQIVPRTAACGMKRLDRRDHRHPIAERRGLDGRFEDLEGDRWWSALPHDREGRFCDCARGASSGSHGTRALSGTAKVRGNQGSEGAGGDATCLAEIPSAQNLHNARAQDVALVSPVRPRGGSAGDAGTRQCTARGGEQSVRQTSNRSTDRRSSSFGTRVGIATVTSTTA